jgi:hypothetical protein
MSTMSTMLPGAARAFVLARPSARVSPSLAALRMIAARSPECDS